MLDLALALLSGSVEEKLIPLPLLFLDTRLHSVCRNQFILSHFEGCPWTKSPNCWSNHTSCGWSSLQSEGWRDLLATKHWQDCVWFLWNCWVSISSRLYRRYSCGYNSARCILLSLLNINLYEQSLLNIKLEMLFFNISFNSKDGILSIWFHRIILNLIWFCVNIKLE